METRVSLNSAAADLLAYGRTRIARRRIAVLVAALAALAFIVEVPRDAGDVLLRTALAALLVVSFRVWDDLADRTFDSARNPDRVLAHSTALRWFWATLAGVAAITAGALGAFGGTASLPIYAGLIVLLAVVYHGPWELTRERFIRTQLVLLKYPAFIAMLGVSGVTSRTVLCAAAGYLLISLHEWRDDPALRERYPAGRLAVVFVIGLIAALSLAADHG
jgi:hypothetical protein